MPQALSPRFSVITPAYKARATIARAVASLLAQSESDFEHLIISDEPLQDYQVVLQDAGLSDPRIRFFNSGAERKGPAAARNIGLSHARGDYIIFLDADDVFQPTHLALMGALMQQYPFALSAVEIFDEESGAVLPNVNLNPAGPFAPALLPFATLHTCIPFCFRKNMGALQFDEEMRCFEDFAFMMMLGDQVATVGFNAAPSYQYRKQKVSLTTSPQANVNFIVASTIYLNKIASGKIKFMQPQLEHVAAQFTKTMIEAEKQHLAQSSAPFIKVLLSLLKQNDMLPTNMAGIA